MLPYTPKNKPNLSAWLVARSDGENYGRLRVYSFPKQKLIYGPQQIEGRINQDDVISEKTTLWGQQGSDVVHGTLLVVPIEESLIYVQPLYLQAESGSIPELKRIIVAYENEIAMERTLEEALAKIFGDASVAPKSIEGMAGSSGDTPTGLKWQQLVNVVQSHFMAAESAAREGDWAGYGARTKELGDSIQQLRELANGDPSETNGVDELGPEEAVNALDAGE